MIVFKPPPIIYFKLIRTTSPFETFRRLTGINKGGFNIGVGSVINFSFKQVYVVINKVLISPDLSIVISIFFSTFGVILLEKSTELYFISLENVSK